MPDLFADGDFERLKPMFDAVLTYMEENQPQRVAVWSFVTHVNEYALGDSATAWIGTRTGAFGPERVHFTSVANHHVQHADRRGT